MLVEGHEREYLTWFYRYPCNPAAITKQDIDEYVSHYSAPGGMRAGFEYYRALLKDIKQNKEYSRVKLPLPVLALGGKCSFGTAPLDSMRLLATNVSGGIGYVVNSSSSQASSIAYPSTTQLGLPNPFVSEDLINQKITSEIQGAIAAVVASTSPTEKHVEIKCTFGMILSNYNCS